MKVYTETVTYIKADKGKVFTHKHTGKKAGHIVYLAKEDKKENYIEESEGDTNEPVN